VDSFQITLSKEASIEVTVLCEGKLKMMTIQHKGMMDLHLRCSAASNNRLWIPATKMMLGDELPEEDGYEKMINLLINSTRTYTKSPSIADKLTIAIKEAEDQAEIVRMKEEGKNKHKDKWSLSSWRGIVIRIGVVAAVFLVLLILYKI